MFAVASVLDVPPAGEEGRHPVAGALRDEEDGAAFGAEQPLVRVGGEDVHSGGMNIHRQGPQALDRVDDEEDAALPAEPRDLLDRVDPAVVEGDPRDRDDAGARVHLLGDLRERYAAGSVFCQAALDAAPFERQPRVGVRGKLHVVGDDVVPFLPGEGLRDEVQAPARVGKERDLFRGGSDKPRGGRAAFLDAREPAAPVRRAAVALVLVVRVHGVGNAARERRDGGVVEVDEVPADGEFAVEGGCREIENHEDESKVSGPRSKVGALC